MAFFFSTQMDLPTAEILQTSVNNPPPPPAKKKTLKSMHFIFGNFAPMSPVNICFILCIYSELSVQFILSVFVLETYHYKYDKQCSPNVCICSNHYCHFIIFFFKNSWFLMLIIFKTYWTLCKIPISNRRFCNQSDSPTTTEQTCLWRSFFWPICYWFMNIYLST